MPKEYINPPELFPSQRYGFSQGVTGVGGKTVYLSGQVAWDENQQLVGPGNLRAQTYKALENVRTALGAAGGELGDVVSMRIYIVEERLSEDHHISEALKSFFPAERLPAATWIGVRALSEPDFLIEIEAIAVLETNQRS